MTTGLILAGHGSHISTQTAAIVWEQVEKLRAMHIADEVTACFWKELPAFSRVLYTLDADDITIVPMFTAQGYFTRTVIPTEMGLDGTLTHRDGRVIRYAKTLGEHPYIQEIVKKRVTDALLALQLPPHSVSVAIIGHGTQRNPQSRTATYAQADVIRQLGLAHDVHAVFLDDTPSIPEIYTLAETSTIIAVPYFLALGSHTTLDVPEELGLAGNARLGQVNGKTVFYTDPIGLDEGLTTMIVDLAHEAGASLTTNSRSDGLPTVGKSLFCAQVRAQDPTLLAMIDRLDDVIRLHTHDEQALDALFADIERRYPSLITEWALWHVGQLPLTTLSEVIQRQTGLLKALVNFQDAQAIVQRVCATCERHPLWHQPNLPPQKWLCGEACNWWLSDALESVNRD